MIRHFFETKIYYKDVDKMGITYYSRYLEFFEQARTELFSSIGLKVSNIEDLGIYLPVITCYCDYKISTKFEDKIIIQSEISKTPKARLKIDYSLKKKNSKKVSVSGYTIHAFIKENGKSTRAPNSILKILKNNLTE